MFGVNCKYDQSVDPRPRHCQRIFCVESVGILRGNDDNLSVESDSYPALDTARDRGSFIRHNEALGRWKKVREEHSRDGWGRAWVPMVSGVQCRVEPHLGTPPLTVLWDASRPFIAAIGAIGHCWCWCVNNY